MIEIKNIVRNFLVLATMLVMGYSYAHAQNSGAAPYLNSTHAYRVKIGLADNDKQWLITDKGSPEKSENLLTTTEFDVTYSAAGADGGYDVVIITFDSDYFTAGNWYIQFREYDASSNCTSAREFPITILDNSFYLTASAVSPIKNALDGNILTYAQATTDQAITTVTYSVIMEKADDFDPSYYTFVPQFSQAIQAGSFAVTMVKPTTNGNVSFALNAGVYTVTVEPETAGGQFPDEAIEVQISVQFEHDVDVQTIPELTVASGKAFGPIVDDTAPVITTIDNLLEPTSGTPGDRTQDVTILALPLTQNILIGTGESSWSAANPLQNSTHKYRVQMADADNNTGLWNVEQLNGTDLTLGADYTIVSGPTVNAGYSEIEIHFSIAATEPTATKYNVVFTETATTSGVASVTRRAYAVTLQPPFDVALTAVADDCSGANNVINHDVEAEITSINYKVTLNNASYDATWQFNLQLACAELGAALTAPDANISITAGSGAAIGSTTRAAGTITIPVVVTKGAGVVEKNVTVTVNYSGIYATAHTITATLLPPATPGSFGSFNEVEETADETNNTDGHVIYAIPQPGELAGVD